MKMMHTDDAECQSFFCMVNSMAEPGSILGVQIAWDSNGSFRNWVKTSDILFLRVINSCLHLSLTKWHCSSGRHLVKALNYSNSGDRDLLQKSWNSYNVNCSYPCIFDACTPNNCLWIFFYPPVVTSVIFFFFSSMEPCSVFRWRNFTKFCTCKQTTLRRQSHQANLDNCAMQMVVFHYRASLLCYMNTRFR